LARYADRTPRGAASLHRHWACAALLALSAAAACGQRDAADAPATDLIAVVDDAGRDVILERPARRVISMIPAQTEIVGVLAGRDVLVARTRWDTDPALSHLPSVGNALTPSVEWLAARRPDLIIVWPDGQARDVVQRLGDIGIPVYASRVETVGEVRGMIRRLGVLLGAAERADSLIIAIDAELEAVRAAAAGRPVPSVLYLLSTEPPMAAGPDTFVDDLITLAGGSNSFHDARQLWPQISLEEIVRRQPEVIIRPSARAVTDPLAGIAGRPGWRDLEAVRNGRVHGVDPDLFNRAGATVGEAARQMLRLIHGDSTLARQP
jgi:iron complex transport system substrate-binding protein